MAKKQQRKSAKAVARKREPVRTTTAKKQPQVGEVSGGKAQRLLLRLSKRYGKGPDQIASEIIADFGDTWEEVHEILRRRVARMVDRRVAPIMAAFDGQYNEAMARFERELLLVYLAEAGGGLRRTSRMYGISLSRLRRRIKELGIDISSDLPR
jgi:transcriptional regulator of acetoin/glycerol metabolism